MRTPSPQQQTVIDFVAHGTGSAFVEAVAGAGKTTTLVDALAGASGSVAFVAYNKKIADEIKNRIAPLGFGNRVQAGTFHSFGLRCWRRAYPQVKAGPEAAREKSDRTIAALKIPKPLEGFTLGLMSLAKQRAIGLFGAIDDRKLYWDIIEHFDMLYDLEDETLAQQGVELAITGLRLHAKHAPEIINFDDMIWMPIISGVRMWQNDMVFVDEAQDTNPARRAFVRKMMNPRNGRAVFVGDRHQAIYGFTGADNDAVDQIIRDFHCTSLPMTVTYRCPKAVVAKAQEVVSHIEAHASAPEGSVSRTNLDDFMIGAMPDAEKPLNLLPSDAILCRKTKPLIDTAFALIRAGVACHVEGRDIGAGLIKLISKFDSAKDLQSMLDRLEAYGEQRCEMLTSKGKNGQAEALADRIATIMVIADRFKTIGEVKQQISWLFEDSEQQKKPTLTLSTVHKAKGREWPRVFVLGANQWMPGPWARQPWEQNQERNIEYVAITRAQSELTFIDVPLEK